MPRLPAVLLLAALLAAAAPAARAQAANDTQSGDGTQLSDGAQLVDGIQLGDGTQLGNDTQGGADAPAPGNDSQLGDGTQLGAAAPAPSADAPAAAADAPAPSADAPAPAPAPAAEPSSFTETYTFFPANGFYDSVAMPLGQAIPLPADSTTAVRVELTLTPCDADGAACDADNPAYARAQLYCGTSEDGVWDFISAAPDRRQVIQVSPLSPVAYPPDLKAANESQALACMAMVPNYMPTPLRLDFNVTTGLKQVALREGEQAAARALYDACCQGRGTCLPWDQATEAAGLDFNKGEVFTDLCAVDNNLCDAEGGLTVLNLDSYRLACDLSALDFSNFTALEILSLARNNLTGDFEAAARGIADQLPELQSLDVGGNGELGGALAGADSGLCGLAAGGLRWLGLYRTNVTGALPDCLFSGPGAALEELVAGFSGVSGDIPAAASEAPALAVLMAEYTGLGGAIPALPPTLVKLNLTFNAHTGGVPDFAATKQLTSVDLSNNGLTGAVPDAAAGHPALRFLDLRANDLEGLPKAWTGAAAASTAPLDTLLLAHNPLGGAFPAGLALHPNLTILDVSDAQLGGDLPAPPDGGFPSLDQLYASNNALGGPIDAGWEATGVFNFANVDQYAHAFILPNNSLSGDVPAFLANPYANIAIDLRGNEFANGCDEAFRGLGTCVKEGEGAGDGVGEDDAPGDDYAGDGDYADAGEEGADAGGDGAAQDADSSGGDDGLSSGAIAGIVIAVLAVAGGAAAFVVWRRRRHGGGGARFERFQEDGLEMGRAGTGTSTVYNATLAP